MSLFGMTTIQVRPIAARGGFLESPKQKDKLYKEESVANKHVDKKLRRRRKIGFDSE